MRTCETRKPPVEPGRPAEMAWQRRLAFRERHHPDLCAFCRQRLGDWAEAEDAAEEAWHRWWFEGKEGQAQKGKERAFLFSIALNVCRELSRKRKRPVALADYEDRARSHVERVIEDETAEAVRQVVRTLPPLQSEVVIARCQEGKPLQEVAEALGLTKGSVRGHLQRALASVRRLAPAVCLLAVLGGAFTVLAVGAPTAPLDRDMKAVRSARTS